MRPFLTELSFEVKTYDIDFAGIVNNIVYIRWLEDLRLELLKKHFPLPPLLKEGVGPILLSTKIDYKRPVTIHMRVLGRIWVSHMDGLKWTVRLEVEGDGDVAATAEQVGLFVRLSTGRPVRMPAALLQSYKELTGLD